MGKKILNVLGVLVALVLSLVMIVMLVVTPVISGATKLSQKETIHSMVKSIDLSGVFESEGEDLVTALVDTEFVKEMLNLYVDDLLAELDGEPKTHLTAETLDELKETHKEELMGILREMLLASETENGEQITEEFLTDAMVEEYLDEFYGEYVLVLVEELPGLEELGVDDEVLEGIQALRSKMVQTAAIVVLVVLSLLIFACRFPRFKGFLWLAVLNILVCPVIILVRNALNLMVETFLTEDLMGLHGVIEPVLTVFRGSMMTCAVVYGVLAVIYIAAFVVGRKVLGKKQAVVEEEIVTE